MRTFAPLLVAVALAVGCSQGSQPQAQSSTPQLAGQPASSPTATKAEKKVLVYSRPEDISFLDPQDHFNLSSRGLERLVYDMLVELTPDGKIVPALAASWETKDGKRWTFKLRSGVKFHSGEAFDAKSVKFTLERLRDNAKLRQAFLWATLETVETPDANTAVVVLKEPYGALLANLAITPMLPPEAYKQQGDKLWDKPIGTGPFKFVEWVKGDRYAVDANPDYWRSDKKPKVDRIVYRPILEPATAIAGLQTGEIDIVDSVPPDQAEALSKSKGVQLVRGLAWDNLFLGLKVDNQVFRHKEVRQAVDLALDREALVKGIMSGGKAVRAFIPEPIVGYHAGIKAPARDVAKAKQLLAQAGFANGIEVNMIAPDGWYPKLRELVQAIQAQLGEVGIKVKLEIMEGAKFTERRGAGQYDIFITGGAHNGDPDFLIFSRVVQDVLKSGYRNAEANDLITKARQEFDAQKRDGLYKQAQEILAREAAPHIWVMQLEAIYAVRDGISGFQFPPDKNFDIRWVEKK